MESRWAEKLNKVGMYHLGGGLWKYLLSTIPEPPFKSVVILDGEHKKEAKKICKEYKKNEQVRKEFIFCEKPEDIKKYLSNGEYPVYCLAKRCIEKYLDPKLKWKDNPNYNKKIHGPKRAEEMEKIPAEIKKILGILQEKYESSLRSGSFTISSLVYPVVSFDHKEYVRFSKSSGNFSSKNLGSSFRVSTETRADSNFSFVYSS